MLRTSRTATMLKKSALYSTAVAGAMLATGCANMATTASNGNAFNTLGTMTGQPTRRQPGHFRCDRELVLGGNHGLRDKGSTLLATATSSNDGFGSFQFTQVATQPATIGTSLRLPEQQVSDLHRGNRWEYAGFRRVQ